MDAPADLSCAVRTGEPGDEMQRHVDTRGNSGGRHHIAVIDEARLSTRARDHPERLDPLRDLPAVLT
jgi:hypothetical protein